MKAFVTGGTGLLGSNLIRLLIEQGHQVTALVRSQRKAAQVLGDLPITLVEGDMQNVDGWVSALMGCDTLFHTAAYFRKYYAPGDHWARLKAINIDATLQLFAAAEAHGASAIVDVRDVAQTMINSVDRGRRGERYIVSGRYASLADVAQTVERVAGVQAPKLRLPYPVALAYAWVAQTYAQLTVTSTLVAVNGIRTMQGHIALSSAKAERELDATFRLLENTLRDKVAWFMPNVLQHHCPYHAPQEHRHDGNTTSATK